MIQILQSVLLGISSLIAMLRLQLVEATDGRISNFSGYF